jgi:hypothetical protein
MNMLADGSEDGAKEAALYAINTIKSKYSPEDQERLLKKVNTLVKKPEDVWERNLKAVVEEWNSELNDGWADIIRMSKVKTNPRLAREMEEAGVKK